MKKIIAQFKKPNYGVDVSLFIVFSLIDILLLMIGCYSQNFIMIFITIFLLILFVFIFIVRIMGISNKRKNDNTLIYYENKTFYLPTLNIKISKQEISRVVYEMQRYVYLYLPAGKTNIFCPVKNVIGKLHITYFSEGVENYIKLKNVINPDKVEKTIKNLCFK